MSCSYYGIVECKKDLQYCYHWGKLRLFEVFFKFLLTRPFEGVIFWGHSSGQWNDVWQHYLRKRAKKLILFEKHEKYDVIAWSWYESWKTWYSFQNQAIKFPMGSSQRSNEINSKSSKFGWVPKIYFLLLKWTFLCWLKLANILTITSKYLRTSLGHQDLKTALRFWNF